MRKGDKAVLIEGLGQKDEATHWLEIHARANVGATAPEPVTA